MVKIFLINMKKLCSEAWLSPKFSLRILPISFAKSLIIKALHDTVLKIYTHFISDLF